MGPRSIVLMDTGGFSPGEKSGFGVNLITPLFTAEFHLSELSGTKSHPAMQKIRITGFFFEHNLHWQSDVRLLLFTVCT
jgi:hypothetical protein